MRNHRLTNTHQSTPLSIHTYIFAYMDNNANIRMHTQHPTRVETHTHAHIHAYGKSNMHILPDSHKHKACKYAYMPACTHTTTHTYWQSGIQSGRQ